MGLPEPARAATAPRRSANHERIVAYLKAGIRNADDVGNLGLEVEHFVVTKEGESPAYYRAHDGIAGVCEILERIEGEFPDPILSPEGALIGRVGPAGSVTLEPASQMEISLAPHKRIAEVEAGYQLFRQTVDPLLEERGLKLAAYGYHPTARALDLPLIPKSRYRFMNDHFAAKGTHGERMMRASASTQVSVDFSSEADAVRKMRVAAALAPVLAAISDNTPVFEGEPNRRHIARFALWRDVDNDRCGVIPGIFDEGFGFDRYADWILGTSPIFTSRKAPDGSGVVEQEAHGRTAEELYADVPMTEADIEHVLSMFWPDVRLKRYVEIRPADSLPEEYLAGYVALIKGIFYSQESLRALEDALGVQDGRWPLDAAAVNRAALLIEQEGERADVYGTPLAAWSDLLFSLAGEALPDDERPFLKRLERFAHSER